MSQLSGGEKYRLKRRRYQEEHERIVQEANASFIAHFSNWNKKAPKYRKVITQEFKGRSEITLSYQKQTSRPPSGLKEIDLAVVLDCVHTYGLSSRGISAKRINQALGLCNAGKSLAKVAPALRVLHALGLIEYLGGYHPGKRGNRYRLSKKCMLALHLPIPSPDPYTTKALPMPVKKPKLLKYKKVKNILVIHAPQEESPY